MFEGYMEKLEMEMKWKLETEIGKRKWEQKFKNIPIMGAVFSSQTHE